MIERGGGRERAAASVPGVSAVDAMPSVVTTPSWSRGDLRMRRLLRLPNDAPKASETSARQLVEKSLLISMVRCLLTYVILPFGAPIFRFATGVTPAIGVVVGGVAIVANVASVRRFWRADHRYRWHYTALASVIVVAITWLVISDLVELLG